MSLVAHLSTLQEKHHHLEEAVRQEMAHPLPDFKAVSDMKKLKLHLKEEIERIYRDHPEMRQEAS